MNPETGLQMPIMGNIMPDMGNNKPSKISEAKARYASANLSDALFTATQQRVLACLFGQPDRSFSVSELIELSRSGSGAVQREIARLAGSGLVTVEPFGKQKRYQANANAPIYSELLGIVRKTFGLSEPLRQALLPVADRIEAACVYGSYAKRNDSASSDIDVLLVSDELSYAEAMTALHPLMEQLGRNVNPTLYTRAELQQRIGSGNSFITRVLAQPRLWLIGGEDALRA